MTPIERISRLLNPRSIAVVGASTANNKLAGQLIPALVAGGYRGRIYPVNPRYAEVAGWPAYASVASIPEAVDHCVIVVAKERVAEVIADCREKGVAGASVYTSGYAETGPTGRAEQDALVQLAGDMVFIGPNCMGFSNLVDRVMAAPSDVLKHDSTPGDLAIVSQSGGLAYATIAYFAQRAGDAFSYIVNTGNSAGISYSDLVEFLFADRSTRVVLAIVEAESAAREVIDAVRRLGLQKPVVLFKLGRGATGVRMALSHTGAAAGDHRAILADAASLGIACADDVDEALGLIELVRHGVGPGQAAGIAALCISGGNVTLFADQVDAKRLAFATLSDATEARLASVLPSYISVHNPIDITALGYENPKLHVQVMEVLKDDPAVGVIVPIITTINDYSAVCTLLADFKRTSNAPMIVLWNGGTYAGRGRQILREAGVPVLHGAGLLAQCLARLAHGRTMPSAKGAAKGAPPAR